MQQLTLQFDGYADEQQPTDASTAKQCKEKWLESRNGVASDICGTVVSHLTVIEGSLAVTVTFALIFLAALIGG